MEKGFEKRYLQLLKEENRVNELAYVEKYGVDKMPVYIHGNREKLFGELLKSGKPAEQLKDIPKGIIF